jgi:hypothetical protein
MNELNPQNVVVTTDPRLSPMVNSAGPMPALISNTSITDDSLDQATKAMAKLYVNQDLSPKTAADLNNQAGNPMLVQYHANSKLK